MRISRDYPAVDVGYLSDATDFNKLQNSAYEDTLCRFERLYKGYGRRRNLTEAEAKAIFDIVAIRHYTILSRIMRRQGTQDITREFFDQQYEWLLRWRDICERRT